MKPYDLRSLPNAYLVRLYHRVWERMTRGDGYQPFGYDLVTLYAVHPEWMRVLDAIRWEAQRR
jgi:hypothetical protein